MTNIGDDETPADAGPVPTGGSARDVAVARFSTCAVLDAADVRCWGRCVSGILGHPCTQDLGDDEPADAGPFAQLPEPIASIHAGVYHFCAIAESGQLYCWGDGLAGNLGHGTFSDLGHREHSIPPVPVKGVVSSVALGKRHTCASIEGRVSCWGTNDYGQLGTGDTQAVSNAAEARTVNLSSPAISIAAGSYHTCALERSGSVRCWGWNNLGQLGIGDISTVRDDQGVADPRLVSVWPAD